jgi:hypothetical protein
MKPHASTSYEQLEKFNWDAIVNEFSTWFPLLHKLVLGLMLSPEDRDNPAEVKKVLPKLGMVYAICIQNRIHNLSLVQRMIATILTEGLCDVKVSFIYRQS